jgi:hypothetical protein
MDSRLNDFHQVLHRLDPRRGLVVFGGTILKALFGTATIYIIDLVWPTFHWWKNETVFDLSQATIEQNYFQFEDNYYSQESGLAMGSPMSSIFSEIYLLYMENTAIYDILLHNNIPGYFHYVDNILIVYDKTTTVIDFLYHQLVAHLFYSAIYVLH